MTRRGAEGLGWALVALILLGSPVLAVWSSVVAAQARDDGPLTVVAQVRQVALPRGGGAVAYLETDLGTLTVLGELDEGPLMKWLILHGGQRVTLTVETKPVARAER